MVLWSNNKYLICLRHPSHPQSWSHQTPLFQPVKDVSKSLSILISNNIIDDQQLRDCHFNKKYQEIKA